MRITTAGLRLLKVMLANPKEASTIRGLSKKAGINYRQAYEEAAKMRKEGIISIQVHGRSSMCSINLSEDISLYAYIESLRAKEFAEKHKEIMLIIKEMDKVQTAFFTAILFGSRARGAAGKRSDIDILIVAPNAEQAEVEPLLGALSYPLHVSAVTEESFIEMKNSKGINVVKELEGNHIILAGAEAYCRLMAR